MYYHIRYWWQRLDTPSLPVHHANDPSEPPPPLPAPGRWQVGVDALLLLLLIGVIGALAVRRAARARPEGTAFQHIVGAGAAAAAPPDNDHFRARLGGA
jgi:hypothetical protein